MSITRRSFLKIFAAAPLVAAGLPELSFSEDKPAILNGYVEEPTHVGNMRETIAYDPTTDVHIIRHDVTDGTKQWGVDQAFPFKYSDKELAEARSLAVSELRKKLKENGIKKVYAPPSHLEQSKSVMFA